jgi:hypothetical protein
MLLVLVHGTIPPLLIHLHGIVLSSAQGKLYLFMLYLHVKMVFVNMEERLSTYVGPIVCEPFML